ncbi:MAG TPA: GerMN domain-containing protein [Gaiellales bacterium]|nr:GerMN domain-containing protein [Gaiellales bacterium]
MRIRLAILAAAVLTVSLAAGPVAAAPRAGSRMTLDVWLERGTGKLWLTKRTVPRAPGVAAAAVRLLFAGPNAAEQAAGVTTAVPAGSRLRGISISGGTATIDVSRAFAATAPATRIRMRLAQLTYTATQFPTVKRVRLEVAGVVVRSIAGAPVPQPAARADFRRRLPAILVSRPAIGARVPAAVTVAGSADVFEAALTVRVLNERGRLLARRHILASCGTGCRGRYSVSIPYTVLRRQPGTIVIFDSGGGSVAHPHVVRVPVKLSAP